MNLHIAAKQHLMKSAIRWIGDWLLFITQVLLSTQTLLSGNREIFSLVLEVVGNFLPLLFCKVYSAGFSEGVIAL
jgi:polyferredoxin